MCNRTSCAQVHELPQSHFGDNREGTLFSWLHVYYAHLASVRFEYSVCRGSLMTSWGYQWNVALSISRNYFLFKYTTGRAHCFHDCMYITLLALLVEHSLVHWFQQCVTVHHVPKCMSCHKTIVVKTWRAHCFHDFIYIAPICLHLETNSSRVLSSDSGSAFIILSFSVKHRSHFLVPPMYGWALQAIDHLRS